ncbi:hypothetical protein GCM10010466_39490 [Planomonospora alba]|uniref:Uncharacterized protein n=1 Tax=Planomonospora alba TaxID=161354 RepID=A0ABP6NDA5_9ACTN
MRRTTLTGMLAVLAGIGAGGILIVGIATPHADGPAATRLFTALTITSAASAMYRGLARRGTIPLSAAAAYKLGLDHARDE